MKTLVKVLTVITSISVLSLYGYIAYMSYNQQTISSTIIEMGNFSVIQGKFSVGEYETLEEAMNKATSTSRAIVIDNETALWVYHDFKPFIVITNAGVSDFDTFEKALYYSRRNNAHAIYFENNNNLLWERDYELPESKQLMLDHIKQLPELPRGCEVTSLAMILNYYGVDVDKIQLAEEVKKDPTPYSVQDGTIHFGNPYEGFVGDMYSLDTNGYGVYHGPIYELANTYLEGQVIDITGISFEEMLQFVDKGYPIWTVVNGAFNALPDSEFEIWHTPTGIVKITKRMHSVVLTGFNNNQVYINDPLYYTGNRAIDLSGFKAAWEQMGSQAVVIIGE